MKRILQEFADLDEPTAKRVSRGRQWFEILFVKARNIAKDGNISVSSAEKCQEVLCTAVEPEINLLAHQLIHKKQRRSLANHDSNIFTNLPKLDNSLTSRRKLRDIEVPVETGEAKEKKEVLWSLDNIIGFSAPCVIMLVGGPAVGKTQLCLQMAVEAGIKGNLVCFVDTKAGFSPKRFLRLFNHRADRLSLSRVRRETILKQNMFSYIANTLDSLHDVLDLVEARAKKAKGRIFLVIDSPLAVVLSKVAPGFSCQAHCERLAKRIRALSRVHSMTVLITHAVVKGRRESDDGQSFSAGKRVGERKIGAPALGKAWTQLPDFSIWMKPEKRPNEKSIRGLYTAFVRTQRGFRVLEEVSERGSKNKCPPVPFTITENGVTQISDT